MKTILISSAILFIIVFTSCSPAIIPLRGNYSDKPFEVVSEKPIDSVWSNIIDLFAKKGLSIKVIDKSSGLIVSEKTSLIAHYTFEDDDGSLQNPFAWVVINKIDYMGTQISPDRLAGEWNIRIKSNAPGKTTININLTNIEGDKYYAAGQYNSAQNFIFNGRSTGKFEQIIADLVK